MRTDYQPASAFLRAVIAEQVPLTGSTLADANLRQLIGMTRDGDLSNRDWATLLLSQQDIDTPAVRSALLEAAGDAESIVRAEAMLGLAQRDRALALPLIIEALQGDFATVPVFEAAALVADPSLAELLRCWLEPSDDSYLDSKVREALEACEAAGRA